MVNKRPYAFEWNASLSGGLLDIQIDLSGLNLTAIEIREAYKQYFSEK